MFWHKPSLIRCTPYLRNNMRDARRQRVADLRTSLARQLHRNPLERGVPEHLRRHALMAARRDGCACKHRSALPAAAKMLKELPGNSYVMSMIR